MARNETWILGLTVSGVEIHAAAHTAGETDFCFVTNMRCTSMWKWRNEQMQKRDLGLSKTWQRENVFRISNRTFFYPPPNPSTMTSLALFGLKLLGICFYPP